MKKDKYFAAAGSIMLFAAIAMQLLARFSSSFADWYQLVIYPAAVGTIGRICGVFWLSVVEMEIYFLVILAVWGIYKIKLDFRKYINYIIFFFGLLAFLFTSNCGVNYFAKSFSAREGIQISKYSTEDLRELCEYLVERINQTSGEYHYIDDREGTRRIGVESMKTLGQEFSSLQGYYPNPKQVFMSRILSIQQICGIYSPFTVEANFNGEMPDYNIPHTICHELSHLKGFMREDEANFIGYLACVRSDSAFYQYSGYLTGWVYAGNALAKEDYDSYSNLYENLSPQAKQDLHANNVFWEQFEGKVAEVSNQMNDVYLKVNSQSDGVKSYGRIVDLMLAYKGEQ